MKVKCIRTSINNSDSNVINSDMHDYLIVGSMFFVYGIRFSQGTTYCYLFNNEHLFEVPLELFEVVEGKVSSSWIAKVGRNGDVFLWPELFYQENFLENFAEREISERNEFASLRRVIEISKNGEPG